MANNTPGKQSGFMGETIMTIKLTLAALAFAAASITPSFAAEPIEGNWKTDQGETVAIAKCGGSFCATLKTGTYAGKRIGKMSGSGNSYSGTLTDPANEKSYSGSASISGSSMKMRGCALKILCRNQNWKKI